MDGFNFDEFSRFFARGSSRRGVLALVGAALALRKNSALGAQLGPATCGVSGDACTLLIGCCDGLTCATSTINPSYGVCVPGDGGMVAVGPSLISPFSEGILEDIGATTASQPTGTTATDQDAERDARIAAKKSRKDSRQAKVQTRRNEDQDKREDQQENRRVAAGPLIELELFNKNGEGGLAETLVVTNRDSGPVTLTKIQSLRNPTSNSSLSRTLGVGSSFNFYSNKVLFESDLSDSDEFAWRGEPLCNETPGAGFRVFVGFSSTSVNREYDFLCDGPDVVTPTVLPRKKRKQQQQNRARARSRQQTKNRNQKKSGNR